MKKYIYIFLLIFLSVFVVAEAQTTSQGNNYSAVITWHANNYYPSDFAGKALPTNGTDVSLSVVLTKNQKIVDLSGVPIIWYLDGSFLTGGSGSYQADFRVTKKAGNYHTVMVNIQMPDQNVSASTNIPISDYLAVIKSPYPAKVVQQNSTINLEVIPYFFNISSFNDLLFSWTINGFQKTDQSNDNSLSLNIGQASSQPIGIDVYVENSANGYEFAEEKTNLYVK